MSMVDFTFKNPCEIVFGRETENRAGALVKKYGGKRVLLHYGGGSVKKSGLYDRVVASLTTESIPFAELGGVEPNPRWTLAKAGADMCREQSLDFVLAVGGGSVIDSAKTVALQALHDGDAWQDFFRAGKTMEKALPIGTVLTIPAAGSEMSDSMVITNLEENAKLPAVGGCVTPAFSIMNPELTYTLPPYQIACGVADIMAHMMERYFTNVGSVTVSDCMLEGVIREVMRLAHVALQNPEDYDARSELMWAGTVAHNNFLGCGRVGDWACHDMEHELSALYDIAHGAGLAIVFPAWIRYVSSKLPEKIVSFATRVLGIDPSGRGDGEIAEMCAAKLSDFYRSIGLPASFADAALPSDAIETMAGNACRHGSLGNYVRLYKEDVKAIYCLAVE